MEMIENSDLRRKVRKNLMIVFIISSLMFFAGLISAYIVSKGDVFWMKVKIPSLFWFNTALLLVVSVLIHLALKKVKVGNQKAVKVILGLAMLLGITFFGLQIKAWKMMLDRGIAPINKNIVVFKGRYDDYFTISSNGSKIGLDGNDYLLESKKMSSEEFADLKTFAKQFLKVRQDDLTVPDYGQKYIINYKGEPITLTGGELMLAEGELTSLAFERLQDLMLNIASGRGDFFAKGTYGDDFTMYYRGEPLSYKDRVFSYKGKELSVPMKLSMADTDDKATAYFYLITAAHWLHVFGGVLVLMTLFFRSLKGKYTKDEYAGIAVGGLFWHFLDGLWLFLFLFLLLIH
jgi:cytochrome c oxidase subunit 3